MFSVRRGFEGQVLEDWVRFGRYNRYRRVILKRDMRENVCTLGKWNVEAPNNNSL